MPHDEKIEHRPILKDVAELANLSVSAVSLALRNPRALPKKTVTRVKEAAEKIGYTPDPGLSALAAYRNRKRVQRSFEVIALVSNWTSENQWLQRESAKRLLEGAKERAHSLGYSIHHFWASQDNMSSQRFGQLLVNRGIRGLILAPFFEPGERLDLPWDDFAVVMIERPLHYPNFHHVVPSYHMDMLLVWEKLIKRGYRRVGLVLDGKLAERNVHQWEAAHFIQQLQLSKEKNRVPTLILREAYWRKTLKVWVEKHKPDVVVSRSESNIFRILNSMDYRIPEDIGYVSLNIVDDIEGVSGIYQSREEMGMTAVDILSGLLLVGWRGAEKASISTQVAGVWQDGETLVGKSRAGLLD